MKYKDLLQKLNAVATEMRSMHKAIEDEDRGFTAEERQTWENLQTEYDSLEQRTKDAKAAESIQDFGEETVNSPETRGGIVTGNPNQNDPTGGEVEQRDLTQMRPHEVRATDEYQGAFDSYLRSGGVSTDQQLQVLMRGVNSDWRDKSVFGAGEQRADVPMQTGSDAAGGFLVPEDFAGFITENLQDFSGLREAAGSAGGPTLLPTARGNVLPFPTNDDYTAANGFEDAGIVGETTTVPLSEMTFAQRTLSSYMYTSGIVRLSLQLMQDEAVNLQQYLGRKLGERLGRSLSPHFAAGTGTGQPTGITVASTQGLDIGANDPLGNLTYPNLLELEHSVDPAYRRRGAAWAFHDRVLRAIKGMLDGQSRPLWIPGLAGIAGSVAQPTIDGYNYVVDQGMPDGSAAGRFIVFGDLSAYHIREVLGVQLFRFNERYMDQLLVGFMAYGRWDANLIDTTAVRYGSRT